MKQLLLATRHWKKQRLQCIQQLLNVVTAWMWVTCEPTAHQTSLCHTASNAALNICMGSANQMYPNFKHRNSGSVIRISFQSHRMANRNVTCWYHIYYPQTHFIASGNTRLGYLYRKLRSHAIRLDLTSDLSEWLRICTESSLQRSPTMKGQARLPCNAHKSREATGIIYLLLLPIEGRITLTKTPKSSI